MKRNYLIPLYMFLALAIIVTAVTMTGCDSGPELTQAEVQEFGRNSKTLVDQAPEAIAKLKETRLKLEARKAELEASGVESEALDEVLAKLDLLDKHESEINDGIDVVREFASDLSEAKDTADNLDAASKAVSSGGGLVTGFLGPYAWAGELGVLGVTAILSGIAGYMRTKKVERSKAAKVVNAIEAVKDVVWTEEGAEAIQIDKQALKSAMGENGRQYVHELKASA